MIDQSAKEREVHYLSRRTEYLEAAPEPEASLGQVAVAQETPWPSELQWVAAILLVVHGLEEDRAVGGQEEEEEEDDPGACSLVLDPSSAA